MNLFILKVHDVANSTCVVFPYATLAAALDAADERVGRGIEPEHMSVLEWAPAAVGEYSFVRRYDVPDRKVTWTVVKGADADVHVLMTPAGSVRAWRDGELWHVTFAPPDVRVSVPAPADIPAGTVRDRTAMRDAAFKVVRDHARRLAHLLATREPVNN